MKKTLKITTEIELKLVQDTRIDPNVIHLYAKGEDAPIMQFYILDGKLVFHRLTGINHPLVATEKDLELKAHAVIKEDITMTNTHYDCPTSDKAFEGNEATTAVGCGGGAMEKI